MRESAIKTLLHNFYQSKSPIPYIITIQVAFFLIITISGFFYPNNTSHFIFDKLSLATSINEQINQPWSILTFPFAYNRLLPLLFDCLWLYWIGNMFLNLLSNRNFLIVFGGGLIIGAIINVAIGSFFPILANIHYHSITYGIAALLTAQTLLNPKSEINLLLLGNIQFKIIAIAYILISGAALFFSKNYPGFWGLLGSAIFGMLYIKILQSGENPYNILNRKKQTNFKIIYGQNNKSTSKENDMPSQELIDSILDKISKSGYDNLSKKEKETLFKLSNKDQ